MFKYTSLWEIFLIQTTTYTNHNNVLGSLLLSPGHAVYTSSNDAHRNPEPPARLPVWDCTYSYSCPIVSWPLVTIKSRKFYSSLLPNLLINTENHPNYLCFNPLKKETPGWSLPSESAHSGGLLSILTVCRPSIACTLCLLKIKSSCFFCKSVGLVPNSLDKRPRTWKQSTYRQTPDSHPRTWGRSRRATASLRPV